MNEKFKRIFFLDRTMTRCCENCKTINDRMGQLAENFDGNFFIYYLKRFLKNFSKNFIRKSSKAIIGLVTNSKISEYGWKIHVITQHWAMINNTSIWRKKPIKSTWSEDGHLLMLIYAHHTKRRWIFARTLSSFHSHSIAIWHAARSKTNKFLCHDVTKTTSNGK